MQTSIQWLTRFFPLLTLLLTPLGAYAQQTIEGVISGYNCAVQGTTCPTDRSDPHIALEPDFVVYVSKDEYYLMPNVPRDTKVRHVLKQAKVTGEVDEQHQAVSVEELEVKQNGEWEKVWSRQWQQEEMERLYGSGTGFPGKGMTQ